MPGLVTTALMLGSWCTTLRYSMPCMLYVRQSTAWCGAAQAAAHAEPKGKASEEAAAEAADDGPAEGQAQPAADEPADGEADEGDGGEAAEEAAAEEVDAAKPAPADGDDAAADAEPETEEKPAQVDPASMTVAQLKEQLAGRGLSVQGRKTDLVARLTEALAVRLHGRLCNVVSGCMLRWNMWLRHPAC